MTRLTTMERYLSAHAAEKGSLDSGPGPRARPFITISRQAGAGGHELAETLLEVFDRQEDVQLFGGWQVFDRKLCEIVADTPAYSQSMTSLVAEEYRTKTDEFFRQILGTSIDQDLLMHRVFQVVGAVASIGKSIIIGRGASEVTRDVRGGVSVRLVAPEELRVKGVMDFYGMDERAARAEARKLDGSRARLLKIHFQADIDDPLRYDVTWNAGRSSFREIAESIAGLLRTRVTAAPSGTLP